jgi:hypothetical protein
MKINFLQIKEKIRTTKNDFGWIFWPSVLLIHVIFFAVFYHNNNIYMADSKEYLYQAYNLKTHLSAYCADLTGQINPALYTKRPPLYGLMILFLKTIYSSNYFILLTQSLFSLLNIFGLIRLLKEYNFDLDARKALFIFIIFFPAQYIYCNMIMSEILLQTLIFWGFYNIIYYLKYKKNSNILYYNILLGLAVLTKPVLVYFWIPNLLFMIYLYFRNRRFSLIIYSLIQPLVILLFTLYSYSVTGNFNYSSQKPVNYLDYTATFLLINVHGEEAGWKKYEEIHSYLDTISSYPFMTKEAERIATEIIMDNKLAYAKFHLKGMLNYFFDPGRYDLNYLLSIKEKNHTGLMFAFAKGGYGEIFSFVSRQPFYIIGYLAFMLTINMCLVLSLVLFLFSRKISPEIKIFLLFMAFYMSFVSGILGTMRYKTHIYFLLLFSLPFSLDVIKSKIRQTKEISKKEII